MKQLSLSRMVAVACILCASSAGASAAQNKHGHDPARWYKGDSTHSQRMQTLKKELNAAYAEQTAACKKKSSSKRSSCLRQARAIYQHDSANARELVANAPKPTITERVVSITPAGGQSGTEPGSSAYGGSGAGQTGSGSSGMQQSGMQSGMPQSGAQQSGASQTGAAQSGATGYGSSQSPGSSTPPVQQGAQSGSSTNQSMGAGTGATRSDTQGQQGTGTAPPVQR
jgi:hypothetical protein